MMKENLTVHVSLQSRLIATQPSYTETPRVYRLFGLFTVPTVHANTQRQIPYRSRILHL